MLIRFLRDQRGNFTILSTVMMTALVGMAGFVTDYGNGLFNHMENQRTADIAAISGADNYANSKSTSSMTTTVNNITSLNGYSNSNVNAQLVAAPSGDGNNAVQVTVTSNVPLMLSKLLTGSSSLPVTATSYAEIKITGGTGCILALDPTANQAITISGSANETTNCDVISNSSSSSSIDMSGSSELRTPCTVSVGLQVTGRRANSDRLLDHHNQCIIHTGYLRLGRRTNCSGHTLPRSAEPANEHSTGLLLQRDQSFWNGNY